MTRPDILHHSHRRVIKISGPDAKDFLQRVITQGPEGVTSERALFSALLTPQGKIISDFFIFQGPGDTLFFDVPADHVDMLVKRFTMYRLRAEADIEACPDFAVMTATERLDIVTLSQSPDPRDPDLGWRAIVPVQQAQDYQTDVRGYHQMRMARIVPEFGFDYDEQEVFSTDVNHDLLGGIHYKKGCFVGQEVASRMKRKGTIRKRTANVQANRTLPTSGAIQAGEKEIGTISSVYGQAGLARIRLDRLEAALAEGLQLSVEGQAVIVSPPHEDN